MPQHLSPERLALDLAVPDLTDPADGPHAIQLLVDRAVAALVPPATLRLHRGERIVAVEDNYDDLRFTADATSRDARYTRYVDDARLLRSHASAMIPAALRGLAADDAAGHTPEGDVLLACPGIVYRRDSIDRLHTGTPHQLDLWLLSRRPLGDGDMRAMVDRLAHYLLPACRTRVEPREHPYTLYGRQVDIADGGRWVEVWECGVAHPDVLARAGLVGWHGLALGMGLDRLLMLIKGIPDIRLLRSTDPRVAAQMQDLSPYHAVSSLPPVRRDLSLAVDAADDVERLGDRVREALGADADVVEEATVLAETDYTALPPAALERMGLREGQKNVLLRLVLRPLERTITDEEANVLRDRVYAALHKGTRAEWATAS